MNKEKAFCSAELLLCFLLITVAILHQTCAANNQQTCAPSSCGKITNIRHPFRLNDDPQSCGDPSYELACENNITVLYKLFPGSKYYVQEIDYTNFTIRLVDAGISEADCSSIPRYFLSLANFSDSNNNRTPYESRILYESTGGYTDLFLIDSLLFGYVVYLNCSKPVRDDPRYVDTTPCVNWHSKGHIYAIAGDLAAAALKADCRVMLVAASSSPSLPGSWGYYTTSSSYSQNFSYPEIHSMLSYGFDVSWMSSPCKSICDDRCYLNESRNIGCSPPLYCRYTTPLGFDACGNVSTLRKITEDYAYGLLKGIFLFANQKKGFEEIFYQNMTKAYYDLYVIEAGVVTGRFVVPYIIIKFILGFILFCALLIYTCRRRHISMYENIEDFLQGNTLMPIRYSYKEIKKMTGGFKDKLGEGGFGLVYKGKLQSGPFVAIKMLGKAKVNDQEFFSEVATIGRIYHANVVKLIGFSVEGSKRALVYEFMPNGSLDKYIFSKKNSISLTYEKIFDISLGVARGIAYLHQGCDIKILHFDIKPHNILLDENFVAKISDFGLARLSPIDKSIITLTAARGTIGYMAPELFYQNIGPVSYKADIYSFGMLLMEMASRRKNLNPHAENESQIYFPFWIYDKLIEENKKEMNDLVHEERNELAKKMFLIALWCIQLKPSDRPPMNKVVEMLEGDVDDIEMPPKPSLYPNDMIQGDLEMTASDDSIASTSFDEEMTTNPLLRFST